MTVDVRPTRAAAPVSPTPARPADIKDESWRERALCAQTDPDVFHPELGESTAAALRICSLCEVRLECLDFALATGQEWGVWGGMTQSARTRLLRKTGRIEGRRYGQKIDV